MNFEPIPDRTRWEGPSVSLWILVIDSLLFTWALRRSTDWLQYVLLLVVLGSLPILIQLLYRSWAVWTLEYWVDRNAVTIRWANISHVIPVSKILRIVEGGAEEDGGPQWYHWPAPSIRRSKAIDLPNVLLCATRPLPECLLLDTGDTVYAVSPQRNTRFLEHLQESYRLGPAIHLTISEVRSGLQRRLFGENQVGVVLLGIGLVGVLALFGRLMVQFPNLPSPLPLRYTHEGLPEVVRDKAALFIIPAIGLLSWLTNGLWGAWMVIRKQPVGAYMLWGGAIIVQIFSFLALSSLLP
jgi:hypothetical protein